MKHILRWFEQLESSLSIGDFVENRESIVFSGSLNCLPCAVWSITMAKIIKMESANTSGVRPSNKKFKLLRQGLDFELNTQVCLPYCIDRLNGLKSRKHKFRDKSFCSQKSTKVY